MSQNDFNIANQGFPATRADINSALQALASTSAGTTEPGTIYAYQLWYDETADLLKMRNGDNDAWITLAAFDQATDEWEIRTAVIQAVDSAGVVIKTDDGIARISVADSGAVSIGSVDINGGTIDGTVIGGSTPAAGTFTTANVTGNMTTSGNVVVQSSSLAYPLKINVTVGSTAGIEFEDPTTGSNRPNIASRGTSLAIETDSTERLRVTSAGDLGVGTTSPIGATQAGSITASGVIAAKGFLAAHQTAASIIEYNSNVTAIRAYGATAGTGVIAFNTGGGGGSADTERMRIDASGNLLVGTTSAIGTAKVVINGDKSIALRGASGINTGNIDFLNPSAALYWSISTNQTNFYIADDDFSNYAYLDQNPTSWQFASDRRIKADIQELDYGLDAVMAIKPKRYKLIASGKEDIGFIAQDLREVVPEAVSGTEIEFFDTDTPQERVSKTLGVGKETLIPVLVKAIQEQQAIIEALEARVAALEA